MKFSSVAVREVTVEDTIVGWTIVGTFRGQGDKYAKCDIFGELTVWHLRDNALEDARQCRKYPGNLDYWRLLKVK